MNEHVRRVTHLVQREVEEFNSNSQDETRAELQVENGTNLTLSIRFAPRERFNLSNIKFHLYGIDVDFIVLRVNIQLHPCGDKILDLNDESIDVTAFACSRGLTDKQFFPLSLLIERRTREMLRDKQIFEFYEDHLENGFNNVEALMDLVEDTILESTRCCFVTGRALEAAVRPRMINKDSAFNEALNNGFALKLLTWYIIREPHLLEFKFMSIHSLEPRYRTSQNPTQPALRLGNVLNTSFIQVKKVFQTMPSISYLRTFVEQNILEQELTKISHLTYKFALWIVLTNRLYLQEAETPVLDVPKTVKQYVIHCPTRSDKRELYQDVLQGEDPCCACCFVPNTQLLNSTLGLDVPLLTVTDQLMHLELTEENVRNVRALTWCGVQDRDIVACIICHTVQRDDNMNKNMRVYSKSEVLPKLLLIFQRSKASSFNSVHLSDVSNKLTK